MWTRQFKTFIRVGETRRIVSVNPTYDWTCLSYGLLNVSPMQVESSPPLPCPEPCHKLAGCTQCLASHGADGGWQHCVWSMALQQVPASTVTSRAGRLSVCLTVLRIMLSCGTPLTLCSMRVHLVQNS
ncbi:multiple epidermal growth factor-like domains protein 8 [Alosa pseudoharengus]|uniref:multiple epidermal growth factor-like domains protein 8 n=1 Tax=Alosa pseudoharengus TaxID=34774 RepID=UPI003F891D04